MGRGSIDTFALNLNHIMDAVTDDYVQKVHPNHVGTFARVKNQARIDVRSLTFAPKTLLCSISATISGNLLTARLRMAFLEVSKSMLNESMKRTMLGTISEIAAKWKSLGLNSPKNTFPWTV